MLRIVQVITGVIVVGLSVASAVLSLLLPRSSSPSPHQISHEPVPLLNVVSGLLLSVLIITNSIIIGYIQLLLQLVISLVYIVSGILQVVTTPSTSHTIIFIVDVIFITLSMLISSINYLQPSPPPPSPPPQQQHQQDEESTIGSTIHQDEKYTYKLSTPNNPIRTSISTPNFVTHQTKKNNNKVQTSNSLSTLVSASTNNISRDPSSLLMLEVDDEEEEEEEDVTDIVRRSKSMIVSCKVKRWKSIHEEKAFLSNVNDCLLPPVLKGNKEKSPIQEQQEIQDLPYIAEFDESNGDVEFVADPEDLKVRRKSNYGDVLTGLEPIPQVIQPDPTKRTITYYTPPPKEPRADHIDNMSDLSTTTRNPSSETTPSFAIDKTAVPSRIPSRTPSPPTTKSVHTSPLRKLFQDSSPKRILKHKHTSSSMSRLIASPHKVNQHRHSVSVPTFKLHIEAIDQWDVNTSYNSEESRNSSVPSAVLGQYDREKWDALKLRGQV